MSLQQYSRTRPLRGLYYAFLAVLGLLALGTVGYMRLTGAGVLDALLMTVITVSTVGYREFVPLDTAAAKLFTVGLILAALLVIAWAAGTLAIVVGLGVSFSLDLATGPVLVLMFGVVLVVAMLLWPRYGVRVTGEGRRGLRVPAFTANEPSPRGQTRA